MSSKNSAKIFAVGIGPGAADLMAPRAAQVLRDVDVICGYTKYLEMLPEFVADKEAISSGMTGEIDRCQRALDAAKTGKSVAVVSSGDAGIYAMAGLLLELMEEEGYQDIDFEVVPGITAANAAAAVLGAPLMNDFAMISLSDLMTPQDEIRKRLRAIASTDMVCVLYNPRSKKRLELFDFALEQFKQQRGDVCYGMVRHASREEQKVTMGTLSQLPVEDVDMSTVVLLGSSQTVIRNKRLYTLRGYRDKYLGD